MEQIERIKYFEKLLDKGYEIEENLIKAIEAFEDFDSKFKELDEYSQSKEWMQDFESDENNELPNDLKRGVLGEDYLYDLVVAYHELKNKIK